MIPITILRFNSIPRPNQEGPNVMTCQYKIAGLSDASVEKYHQVNPANFKRLIKKYNIRINNNIEVYYHGQLHADPTMGTFAGIDKYGRAFVHLVCDCLRVVSTTEITTRQAIIVRQWNLDINNNGFLMENGCFHGMHRNLIIYNGATDTDDFTKLEKLFSGEVVRVHNVLFNRNISRESPDDYVDIKFDTST